MANLSLAPRRVATIALPAPAAGETVSPNGRFVLAATGSGAAVIGVLRAEQGSRKAVRGVLSSGRGPGGDAVEVSVAPGNRFAFVSLGSANEIAVFDLRAAVQHGFRTSGFVGMIPLDGEAGGMAISSNGRWLYVTSEVAGRPSGQADRPGTLSVIDLHRAQIDPARALVGAVTAGCGPVHVAVGPRGDTVWVTARGSNALLGFSANKLIADRRHALVADVQVGQAPVGLAVVASGARIVVADSDPLAAPGSQSGLTVVDTAAALAGKPAVLGLIPAGSVPRDEAVLADGSTLLVTNFASDQLEAVDLATLP